MAVLSGASSVPVLSGAVAEHLALGLDPMHCIDIGISPGNRTERGLSTIHSKDFEREAHGLNIRMAEAPR